MASPAVNTCDKALARSSRLQAVRLAPSIGSDLSHVTSRAKKVQSGSICLRPSRKIHAWPAKVTEAKTGGAKKYKCKQ